MTGAPGPRDGEDDTRMSLNVHELHTATFHAPLALLPSAAAVDFAAALAGHDNRSPLSRLGRLLWWLAAGAGIASAVAGLAAIPKRREETAEGQRLLRDMIRLHSAEGMALILIEVAIALRRTFHRPHVAESLATLIASSAGTGAAFVGASRGRRQRQTRAAASDSVAVLSLAAPRTLLREAARGLRWLIGPRIRDCRPAGSIGPGPTAAIE
jgi:uncharacterized membrane protein